MELGIIALKINKIRMERIIKLFPAFDKRNADSSKNYGIHGVEMIMVLKGELGATQFVLYTNWQLPHVQKELRSDMSPNKYCLFEPLPADLGYHSYKPMYEGQTCIDEKCEFLNGSPCYYDGSSLNAKRIYDTLLEKGSDGVWKELEEYYLETFGELK